MTLHWWWLRLWGTAELLCPSFYKRKNWSMARQRLLHLELLEPNICIRFCFGVSLCLQNSGCLWLQACCLEKEVHGSKLFMSRFWSWGASVGHSMTQGTCGRPKNTTQSGICYSAWNTKLPSNLNGNINDASTETLGMYIFRCLYQNTVLAP